MVDIKKTPHGSIKLDPIKPPEQTTGHEAGTMASHVKNAAVKKVGRLGLIATAVGTVLVAIGYLTPKATERDTEVTGRSDTKPQKLDDNAPAALREELRREAERLNKMQKEKSSALPPTQQFAEVSASVESPYEARQVVAPAVTPPRPSGMG
jgi:hypothetical protein